MIINPETRDNYLFLEWPFCATPIEILGSKAFKYLGRHGGGWQVFDENHAVIELA